MKIVLALLVLCLFTAPVFAQTTTQKLKLGVSVHVEIDAPSEIKNFMQSRINRELRAISDLDITIAQYPEDWLITIIAIETRNNDGHKTGYCVSTTFLHKVNIGFIDTWKDFDPDRKAVLRLFTDNTYSVEGQSLDLLGNNDLEEFCKTIISTFDTRQLEKIRPVSNK